MSLADYQTLVTAFVRDDNDKITPTDRDNAITRAVERYSKDKPRLKVEDINGLGTQLLAVPAGWVDEFSALSLLEYPIGSVPPSLIEQDDVSIYRSPSGPQIQLRVSIPVGAANVRATYTIKHQLDGAADTIPADHREPVACWAAASLCEQLATLYAGQSDSTIQADSVDYKSKSSTFASRAKALRARYTSELGINDVSNVAAGVVVSLTDRDSRGQQRLTHPMNRLP
jgi:hypothetical protein